MPWNNLCLPSSDAIRSRSCAVNKAYFLDETNIMTGLLDERLMNVDYNGRFNDCILPLYLSPVTQQCTAQLVELVLPHRNKTIQSFEVLSSIHLTQWDLI